MVSPEVTRYLCKLEPSNPDTMLCDYVSTNTIVNNNGKCHDSTDIEVTRCLCKLEPSNPDTMLCQY